MTMEILKNILLIIFGSSVFFGTALFLYAYLTYFYCVIKQFVNKV